ncbi:RHS repeat-associated core domain-containing protein [Pseudomonas sp. nanlin1]|uniref:RHS repeat-associated core domain-containing protein n=1 Tax=Pseudomonas sp. nanlin1 TaxID=3040605 RepID=UPI00388F8DFE
MPTHRAPTLLAVDRAQSVLQRFNQTGQRPSAYSAYGDTPAPAMAPLGFNGQRRELGNGLYLLGNGHRAYSPVLRRFSAPDRLSPFDAGGLNAYAYCGGDPINRSDPTGAFPFGLLANGFLASSAIGGLTFIAGTGVMIAGASIDNTTMAIVGFAGMAVGVAMTGASMRAYIWARKRAMVARAHREMQAWSAIATRAQREARALGATRAQGEAGAAGAGAARVVSDRPPTYIELVAQEEALARAELRQITELPAYDVAVRGTGISNTRF